MPPEYQKTEFLNTSPRGAAYHNSTSGISRPAVQLKNIDEFVQKNQQLDEEPDLQGNYTTVGMEWNMVTLEKDSYPFVGMSHIELAESTDKLTGVRHKLETESSNRLEYVAPPFYVRNIAPGSTEPEHDELKELIDAQRNGLQQVLSGKKTLGELMGDWPPFLTSMKPIPDLAKNISSRNWSIYTPRTEASLKQGLNDKSLSWEAAKIQNVLLTLEEDYQINVVTDAATYEDASGKEGVKSRLDSNKVFLSDAEGLYDALASAFPDCSDVERKQLILFNKQLARVLRQQTVVPLLRELREKQDLLANDLDLLKQGKFQDRFGKIAEETSFIKDQTSVWLKTDLLAYGLNLFTTDKMWELEKEVILKAQRSWLAVIYDTKAFNSEELREDAVRFMDRVFTDMEDVLQFGRETALTRINNRSAALFEHNPLTLGVRQDTFIPEATLRALKQRLHIGNGGLSVMELRNANSYLAYLAKKQNKQSAPKKGWWTGWW